MQILIVTSEFETAGGGLSRSCINFACMIRKIGFEVIVALSAYVEKWEAPEDLGFKIVFNKIRIAEGGYKKHLKEHLFFRAHFKNVAYEVKNHIPDLVIAFGAGQNGLFASELALAFNRRLLVLLRGSEINLSITDTLLYEVNKICLQRSSAVVALSQELINRSHHIFFDRRIYYKVIPLSVDCKNEIDVSFLSKEIIVLGCGSRYVNEKKGISNLIEMLSNLNNRQEKHFFLEIAGEIDKDLHKEYYKQAEASQCHKDLIFHGNLTHDEFIKKIASWDIYVQASYCEGFSNSMADCLRMGKSFIITNTGFIAESIIRDAKALVFENFIPEDMANKVMELTSNTNILAEYEAAYKIISRLGSESDIEESWLNMLERISLKKSIASSLSIENILSVVLHDISSESFSNIDMPEKDFFSFVKKISENGYCLCSSADYFRSVDREKLIVCTFDDGYTGVYDYAFPIMKEFGFSATVFICSGHIGEYNSWNFKDKKKRLHLNGQKLTTLRDHGWEIASHGISHKSLLQLSDEELGVEITVSKSILEKQFGPVESFAYPFGDYNEYIKEKVAKSYNYAFSLTSGGTLLAADKLQIRRYFVSELLNILKI